jgi:hypothetical protein
MARAMELARAAGLWRLDDRWRLASFGNAMPVIAER